MKFYFERGENKRNVHCVKKNFKEPNIIYGVKGFVRIVLTI